MNIGIDARGIRDGFKGGVGEYTQHITQVLNHYSDLKLETLSTGLRQSSDIGGVLDTWIPYPNKLLNISLKLASQPYIDSLFTRSPDKIWMPNWNITAISPETELILTVHDIAFRILPEVFSWRMRLWHQYIGIDKLLTRANTIIAVSESTKRDLIDIYQVNPDKIQVIYSGIDPLFRQPIQSDAIERVKQRYQLPERYILYLGTIEPRKNIQLLIRAFEKLATKDKDIRLVIAGVNGWLYHQIHRMIDNSLYSDRILRIGFVDIEDKPIVYHLAQIFVYPSLYEGFGFPPLEAMASGTPTIVANNSAFPEIVLDAAYKTSPYDVLELTDIMNTLLTDKTMHTSYKELGLKRSLNFDWNNTGQRVHEILSK